MHEAQICSFYLNQYLIAIEIEHIQEVVKGQQMTIVPLAPSHVCGLINLRGQLVMALNLKECLGLEWQRETAGKMNVVIIHGDSLLSLLVDAIGDVITINPTNLREKPVNLPAKLAELTKGIYQLHNELLILIDVQKLF